MCFDHEDFPIRPDNAEGEGEVAQREESVVAHDVEVAVRGPDDEPDGYAAGCRVHHPGDVHAEVETLVALAVDVEFGNGEEGGGAEVLFEDAGRWLASRRYEQRPKHGW